MKFNLSLASKPVADIDLYGNKVFLYRFYTSDLDTFIALQNTIDCYERIKKFLPLIAGLGNKDSKNLKEKREQLSASFLNKISNSDLDKIADVYLSTPVMQGTFKQFSESNSIPEREGDELSSKYLDRLINKYIKDYTDKGNVSKNIALSLLKDSSLNKIFDPTRQSSATLGLTLGRYEKLKEQTSESYETAQINNTIEASQKAIQIINEQNKKVRDERRHELELVKLTADMSAESAKLLQNLSTSATSFLVESERRRVESIEHTNSQLWIAIGSLIASVLLSGFALYYSYQSYIQDKENNVSNDKSQNKIIGLLSKQNETIITLSQQNIGLQKEIISLQKKQLSEKIIANNLAGKPNQR